MTSKKNKRHIFFVDVKDGLYFWEAEWASQRASTSVCVVVFNQAWLCAWAVPRPGLGGLSEISCKRITDHASLAYWFTAKDTYTQNLFLSCSICYLSVSLILSNRRTLTKLKHRLSSGIPLCSSRTIYLFIIKEWMCVPEKCTTWIKIRMNWPKWN